MIDVDGYVVTDPYFGRPYIDTDEERLTPLPHRHIHGGFEGTATRFRFYFPPQGSGYEGRMFNPLSGANGGTEDFFATPFGEMIGGLSVSFRLGGYMVESNQGHIGDELDPAGGDDATLYGHRASGEVARFSKFVAAHVYGAPPHHSYVFGGSGGGRRSPLCLENCPGVWDGALPFMGGGDVDDYGTTKCQKGAQNIAFSTMFNCQRILGDRLGGVVDAMAPGGSGDPFAGLNTHQREELAALYRLGYPRQDEFMIGAPMGQMWLWTSQADRLYAHEPDYFDNFWSKPGYVGHDQPELVAHDIIDKTVVVSRVLTAQEILDDPTYAAPEHAAMRNIAFAMSQAIGRSALPVAVELDGVGSGYRLGAGVLPVSGKAKGRQLYTMIVSGDLFLCDGMGENSNQRFSGMIAGDEVHLDNRRFLAYCYYARHHIMDDVFFDQFRVDGRPIYQQHELADMSPLMGVPYSGRYAGKLIWVHHTHDSSLWPAQGIVYQGAVRDAQGDAGLAANFCQRWTDRAEHLGPVMFPSQPGRATNTWLIDYVSVIEQSLKDLVDWVERDVQPAANAFEYHDGLVTLPTTAAERGGIQPVVVVTANGATRADAVVGEAVTLQVHAAVPPGAGSLIAIEWDFDGSGTYPFRHDSVDGTTSEATLTTTHTYDRPGVYFVTARVESHRDGDVAATSRRIPNLAQARVVVG
jgi:hypothetical protein